MKQFIEQRCRSATVRTQWKSQDGTANGMSEDRKAQLCGTSANHWTEGAACQKFRLHTDPSPYSVSDRSRAAMSLLERHAGLLRCWILLSLDLAHPPCQVGGPSQCGIISLCSSFDQVLFKNVYMLLGLSIRSPQSLSFIPSHPDVFSLFVGVGLPHSFL